MFWKYTYLSLTFKDFNLVDLMPKYLCFLKLQSDSDTQLGLRTTVLKQFVNNTSKFQ